MEAMSPFISKRQSILSVAFKKLGYRLEIKVLANKRSLTWASLESLKVNHL
jgi:hypothetical protein